MRVLLIGPSPPLRGGIAAHTAGLHAALMRSGHRVDVLSYRHLYPGWLFPGSSQRHAGRELGTALLDTFGPSSWLHARRLVAASDADLLLLQWWHPITAPALTAIMTARGRPPALMVCHNFEPHEPFPGSTLLTVRALAGADAFLCHSRAVAARVASLHPDRPLRVSPMPELIERGRSTRDQARRRLGLDARQPVALFLGHARRYKGLDLLLAAWGQASVSSDALLIVAGESYLGAGRVERMVDRSAGRRQVRLLDRYLADEEVADLLAAADVLVLPYRRASQSAVLALGLAAGLRIVASDAGGLAETLPAGPDHHVFRAGDGEALTAALAAALAVPPPAPRPASPAAPSGRTRRPDGSRPPADSWLPTVRVCERLGAELAARGPRRPEFQ